MRTGTPAGNSISLVNFGKITARLPPSELGRRGCSSLSQYSVDMRWAGTGDDYNGIVFKTDDIYRDGANLLGTRTPAFTDASVGPGQTHTYRIIATDYRYNWAPPTDIWVSRQELAT